MTKSSLLIALPITIAALSACSPPPPPNDGGATGPASTGDVSTSNTEPAPTAGATGDTSAVATGDPLNFECRVPAPVKSEDKCTTDADCGVSDPCHAHACVAKAKSNHSQERRHVHRDPRLSQRRSKPVRLLRGRVRARPAAELRALE
ncbi:MAG: hypothetical protein R3B70_10660 [Polyangiaceae bacterium]